MSRPMSRNGYSWVEGRVADGRDPSGLCSVSPTSAFDWRHYRCWELARGLATQFNAPVSNFSWADYETLELVALTGSLAALAGGANQFANDALIIPRAFFENPQALMQAFQEITFLGGYIEGFSGGLDIAAGSAGLGTEVVYNFSTFERMSFEYRWLHVSNADFSIGSLSAYIGHVEGFISHQPNSRPYQEFINQYSGLGEFQLIGLGGSFPTGIISPGLTAGILHFYTPPSLNSSNPIYGNTVYISAGVGFEILPVNFDLNWWGWATYFPIPNSGKQYAYQGRVNIDELVQDILSGDGSPHFQDGISNIVPWRIIAADAARRAAKQYEARASGMACTPHLISHV